MAEVVPNNGEEEIPVFIIRSSIPNGPKGQISFEFRELDGQREVGGLGEIFQNTYNTEEFSLSTVGENSTNFDYRNIADSILQTMNNNIKELTGGIEKLGVLSIVETETEPPQNFYNYTITGTVVDESDPQKKLGNVYITDDVKSVGLVGANINSEPNGSFILEGEYLKDKIFKITFSLNGYVTKTINPFTRTSEGDLILPSTVSIVQLSPVSSVKKQIIEDSHLSDSEIQTVTISQKLQDPGGFATSELLQTIVKTLKTTLLPFVISQISRFGITNAKEALNKGIEDLDILCPSNLDELNNIIEQKNKLTKKLNNTFKTLENIKVGVQTANQIITVAQIVAQTLSTLILAFPAIPFAPDPTKALTSKIPQATGKLKSVMETISDTLAKMKIISSSVLLILNILISIIQQILNYLSLLDKLIQKCAVDGALSQESLSNDLLTATQEQIEQGSSIVTNVNGFEMSILSVEGETDQGLKRRRAIARNKDGVIMLQGEPSFSSNDQILIDELVFYIQQNDLKAN